MLRLISRWKLRGGATPELLDNLRAAVAAVREQEPGTLMYLVHLQAPQPLDAASQPIEPPPPGLALDQQPEVVFVEAYRDADAFAAHVNGPVFQEFKAANLHFFYQDPTRPGWPRTEVTWLVREDGFVRHDAS